MKSKAKNLEKRLTELQSMFRPGDGFGDPEARRNVEFTTLVTLSELQLENKKKIDRIQLWGLAFVVVQTILSVLALLRK